MKPPLVSILEILYTISAVFLAISGLHYLLNTILYWATRKKQYHPQLPPGEPAELPRVTIQLPVYNEKYLITRLLNAVTHLDYPLDRLQIQVLDDSTDDSTIFIQQQVSKYQALGMDLELIHRENRSGFKAGALTEGMKTATGELIAIFDADFLPPTDWLKKTVPFFHDQKLACLQTRWGHTNYPYNSLTRAVALGLDGHFLIEQNARSGSGLFMCFNGTAGLWRKAAIEDAGGWSADTLTEDMDLSYRVQLRGWTIHYLPTVQVPGELPAQIESFKQQQFRWAKGSVQTARKIFPILSSTPTKWYRRLIATLHMTAYFGNFAMVVSLLLVLPIGMLDPIFFSKFGWTAISALGPPLLYLSAWQDTEPNFFKHLINIVMISMIGFGMSFNNTVALMQGLFSKKPGVFVRTPKFNLSGAKGNWRKNPYTLALSPISLGEIALALYAILTIEFLLPRIGIFIVPWMSVYIIGYFYMSIGSFIQTYWPQYEKQFSNWRI